MLRLVLTFILLLKTYLGTANYVFNTSEVTWEDAQKICNIPSVDDIVYLKRDDTELPKTFTAWTSSRIRTSDWTYFYGCLDVTITMVKNGAIRKTLNEYFPKSMYAINADSVFKCAYFCTIQSDFFTFFKNVCKCIHHYELKSHIEIMPVCIVWQPAVKGNVDETYSTSRYTLPIFRFEKGGGGAGNAYPSEHLISLPVFNGNLRKKFTLSLWSLFYVVSLLNYLFVHFPIMNVIARGCAVLWSKMIHKGDREPHKHHCLSKQNGTLMANDCNSQKMFCCEGEFIGQATWSTAINACLHNNGSLSKNEVDFVFNWDYWLPYFRYEEENEPCVAMVKNKNSLSLTYRFRPCSDLLPVLCKYKRVSSHLTTQVFLNHGGRSFGDSTETMFGRTIATTAPNNSDVYGLGIANNEFDLFIRILVGGAAFFATTIIVLLVIIYFQRRKLMKAYFTSLTPRQDENNYNEISETSVGQHYAVEPLYENTASGCHCSVQQNIDQIQHIVTAGYSVHSNVQETIEGHYSTISE